MLYARLHDQSAKARRGLLQTLLLHRLLLHLLAREQLHRQQNHLLLPCFSQQGIDKLHTRTESSLALQLHRRSPLNS